MPQLTIASIETTYKGTPSPTGRYVNKPHMIYHCAFKVVIGNMGKQTANSLFQEQDMTYRPQ